MIIDYFRFVSGNISYFIIELSIVTLHIFIMIRFMKKQEIFSAKIFLYCCILYNSWYNLPYLRFWFIKWCKYIREIFLFYFFNFRSICIFPYFKHFSYVYHSFFYNLYSSYCTPDCKKGVKKWAGVIINFR